MKTKSKPKYIITYLCSNCKMDFAQTEKDKPKCFSCGSTKNIVVIKKERLSPEVMSKRLQLVSERMMENLKKAWQHLPKEYFDDEKMLLEAMVKTKKLSQVIKKIRLKRNKFCPPSEEK